jgi:hypothetical protein
MIAAVSPLLSLTFTAVLPLLIDNSKKGDKTMKTNSESPLGLYHNSGRK